MQNGFNLKVAELLENKATRKYNSELNCVDTYFMQDKNKQEKMAKAPCLFSRFGV